jgi:hypothetical protein
MHHYFFLNIGLGGTAILAQIGANWRKLAHIGANRENYFIRILTLAPW